LGDGSAGEHVWAGLDWGASSVWNVGAGAIDGVHLGGGSNRVDWLDWGGRSGNWDNWLDWGGAGLHDGHGAGDSLIWADGGGDRDDRGDDLGAALVWAVGDSGGTGADGIAGGAINSAGGVHWSLGAGADLAGAGLAGEHWLGWGAAGAGVVVWHGAGGWEHWLHWGAGGGGSHGGRAVDGAGGADVPIISIAISVDGGSGNAGKDNWCETHLEC